MVKQVPDANPLKPLLKQIEHLAAYTTTYRYATTSGHIKPSPDDNTLKADMAGVSAALGRCRRVRRRPEQTGPAGQNRHGPALDRRAPRRIQLTAVIHLRSIGQHSGGTRP